jgi:type III secretory pathway lipoprotein EscJ
MANNNNNWVKVYTAFTLIEAEIILSMLQENGIEAVEMNKKDSSLSFGAVEIYCVPDQVVTALHLINNANTQEN